MISVYETKNFSVIDKKSIKVDNVMDFSWSPTDSILAAFVPEMGGGNQPAKVIVLNYQCYFHANLLFFYISFNLSGKLISNSREN